MLSSTFSADTLSQIEVKKTFLPSFKFTSKSKQQQEGGKNKFLRFFTFKSSSSNNSIKSQSDDNSTLVEQASPKMNDSELNFFESTSSPILFDCCSEGEWFSSPIQPLQPKKKVQSPTESQWMSSPLLSQKSSTESLQQISSNKQIYLCVPQKQQIGNNNNYYSPSSSTSTLTSTSSSSSSSNNNKQIKPVFMEKKDFSPSCRLSNVFDFIDSMYLEQIPVQELPHQSPIESQPIINPTLAASRLKALQTHNTYMAITNQTSVLDDDILLEALQQTIAENK